MDIDLDVLDSAETGTVETIVLEGDTFTQVEEHIDEEEVLQRLRDITGPPAEEAGFKVEAEPAARPCRRHWRRRQSKSWMPTPRWAIRRARTGAGGWRRWGCCWHWPRSSCITIARRWSRSAGSKPLQMLYAPFGVTLEPRWDLAAYEPVQLGGEALAPNSTTLVLKASVHNRATSAQPPPLIRVRLQDRLRQYPFNHGRGSRRLPEGPGAGAHGRGPAPRCRTAAGGSHPPGGGLGTGRLPARLRRRASLRQRPVTFRIGRWEIPRAHCSRRWPA